MKHQNKNTDLLIIHLPKDVSHIGMHTQIFIPTDILFIMYLYVFIILHTHARMFVCKSHGATEP